MTLRCRFSAMTIAVLLVGAAGLETRMTLREVSAALTAASHEHPADLAHRDLSYLDLSGLDFGWADLHGANLHSAELSNADLSRTNLADAIILEISFLASSLACPPTLESLEIAFDTFLPTDLDSSVLVSRLRGG